MAFATSYPSVSVSSAVYFPGQNVFSSGRIQSCAPSTIKLPSRRRTNRTAITASYVSEKTARVRVTPPPSGGSLYDVLGIDSGATCQDIKEAYRRLARVVHPDVNSNGQSSCYEFMKVHEAYATLSDPERRAHYDRILLMHRLNSSLAMAPSMAGVSRPAVARYGGFAARKNWETDQCW